MFFYVESGSLTIIVLYTDIGTKKKAIMLQICLKLYMEDCDDSYLKKKKISYNLHGPVTKLKVMQPNLKNGMRLPCAPPLMHLPVNFPHHFPVSSFTSLPVLDSFPEQETQYLHAKNLPHLLHCPMADGTLTSLLHGPCPTSKAGRTMPTRKKETVAKCI